MQECKVYITLQSCNLEFLILGGTYERETNSDITEAFYYARKMFLVSPEAETVAECLGALAGCVCEVPLTTYAPGYTFFRIGGSVDTDTL